MISNISMAATLLGLWDANSNTPVLSNSTGVSGNTYFISISGTQDLGNGSILYNYGNSVTYISGIWVQIPIGYTIAL